MAESKEKSSKATAEKKLDPGLKNTKTISGKRIYMGPNLPQMLKYTVLEKDLPRHIEDVVGKCPAIKKLLVPVEKLTEYEKRCSVKGTLEFKHYGEILEFIKRGGDE